MTTHNSILLIEDDYDVREALRAFLDDEGYEVACARDAQEALGMLQRSLVPPGLILLDLMMPGMDSAEFRTRQLGDPRLAPIPVVVVSADRLASERSRELDVAACLEKPMKPEKLLEVVRRYC